MPLSPVADGQIASVVTSLEMTRRPPLRAMPQSELRLNRWVAPTVNRYRALFRRVGEPWLWFSRLELSDRELESIIGNTAVHIWAVTDRRGIELGMLELDFREVGQCEIAFFGLVPELAGKGHGKWLMAMALQAGWSQPDVERIWVHTCTLDSPGALGFYLRSGFTAFARQVETFADPRLTGLIDQHAAPHVPLIR